MDDLFLAGKAAEYDLGLTPISSFSTLPLARKGLLLGYGSFSVQTIKDGVRRLDALLRSV